MSQDRFEHVRMECLRLVMEGRTFTTSEEACREADALVDYVRTGHIVPARRGTGAASNLAN